MKLKILSWNIWVYGQFDQIAEFLKAANTDIICLQEVQDDEPKLKVIEYLESLGYQHVFAPVKIASIVWDGKTWNDGPAIFTKHKILSTQIYDLASGKERRAAVRADIQIGDKILHVFNTHLIHTHQKETDVQNKQADELLKILPPEHVVVAGDFNAVPSSTVIQKMRSALIDSDSLSAPTWSLSPKGCVVCNPQAVDTRLDYIFTSKDLKTDSFQVENSQGSDHLAISLNLEI